MVGKFLISSIIIGVITGIFVVLYAILTKLLSFILFFGDPIESIEKLPVWYIYLVPTISILIINYLINKNKNVKEYGVREIAEAVEKNGLMFNIKDLFLKIFASSLSIASGFAIGNEGPSAAIGAMIANKVHNFFKFPQYLLKVSLSIGASSGIAAIFVSPITGIVFAIENLAYEFVKSFSGYLILGGITAFSISYHFLDLLMFKYSTGKFIEFKYILATFLFIPTISVFTFLYLELKDKILDVLNNFLIEKFLPYKNYIFGLIGAFIIGTIMVISPHAAFSGHEMVKILINNSFHLPIWMIFTIILLRIVATSVSLYANAVGGVFIALMSIGALIGYGFAEVINEWFGFYVEPFYFAAIGAAVFMGVNMKLPLTAVVLALEITYDYNVVIPTGISVVIVGYLMSLHFKIKKLRLKKD